MTSPTVTFLLSKDPTAEHGGDIALSRLVMRLAADAFDVRVICLASSETPGANGLVRVLKPGVRPMPLLVGSLRTRRSLVHNRFDVPGLVTAIDASDTDIYVAEHSYMAESFLRSRRAADGVRFVINTVNSESLVWRATRGVVGRLDASRLLADELRVALAADAVGTYDREEADFYRKAGASDARWIELTLEPEPKIDISATGRRLVFMGTRDWPPNEEAFRLILEWWPAISAGIEDAELCVIGAKATGSQGPELPDGVRDLGFVDDLTEFLATCRAMVAPIRTGGGVRVKILDAASKGLPVVGTSDAIGSHGDLFGLTAYDDKSAFVEECRRFLLDKPAAIRAGDAIYELNADRWRAKVPHNAVQQLISP